MDHLLERIEALERQAHRVEQQLHWWRGLACVLIVVALVTWTLPSSTAQEDRQRDEKELVQRVAALEKLLKHFSREKNEVFITGANLHIVNGLGQTDCGSEEEPIPDCPNGLGNLIVGYNEPRGLEPVRTGSHNVVVGQEHNFSSFGGIVIGEFNEISGAFASVCGGRANTASMDFASVSGGGNNTASGGHAAVSGGSGNTASGYRTAVSGGRANTASMDFASVSGGILNTASGPDASVSGGIDNTASGGAASVSGGRNRTAPEEFDWVAGNLFEDD